MVGFPILLTSSTSAFEALRTDEQREAADQVVARLNGLLPKRQFILMRPGRWVDGGTDRSAWGQKFNDIKNAAVLVDILQPTDVGENISSIGEHFLQCLAESGACYLPVFQGDGEGSVNERMLLRSRNVLPELFPEYEFLADVIPLRRTVKSYTCL
jgi:pyruvate,water dikinase